MSDREKLEAILAVAQGWLREGGNMLVDARALIDSDEAVGAAELLAKNEMLGAHSEAICTIIAGNEE